MIQKNARPKTSQRKARPKARRGVTAQMLDAPRSMWDAGLSVLSRGSKLMTSPRGAGAISESLQGGLKKLEEVFDQRVLDSLARTSMPTPQQWHELLDRVQALEKTVARLKRRGGKI